MKRNLRKLFGVIVGCSTLLARLAAQPNEMVEFDSYPLRESQKVLTSVIVHDIFSPPVASRIYVYAHLSAYQVFAGLTGKIPSLSPVIKNLPLPQPKTNTTSKTRLPIISPSLTATFAFFDTGKRLVFSEKALEDSLARIVLWYKSQGYSEEIVNNSREYAKEFVTSFFSWVLKDNYRETRAKKRYTQKNRPQDWVLTPPGYMAAVEPYWSHIRPLLMDSAAMFKPAPPPDFSADSTSLFYKEAREVYFTGLSLTPEQRLIAQFWDCNPFFLNTGGHINFATKKISPGGHWMSIAEHCCSLKKLNIYQSSLVFTLTAMGLFDGFISCWDEKYRRNLIRPESYINRYMDERWRPLLQTPPFPEYTSGHSVVSSISAEILTELFGEQQFTDYTETEFGLPVRNFTSFRQAASEAALSRLYGGIHYRAAIENGVDQGKKIGAFIIQTLRRHNPAFFTISVTQR